MRTIALIISIFFICGRVNAQSAPDFTVTDINDIEHTLYADYLNQGKSVLIEVFFTTCPPCSTYAPHLEEFDG
jgi:thiol-disulfide isomerase/thioredoxin